MSGPGDFVQSQPSSVEQGDPDGPRLMLGEFRVARLGFEKVDRDVAVRVNTATGSQC
jgi:hypothetical protein